MTELDIETGEPVGKQPSSINIYKTGDRLKQKDFIFGFLVIMALLLTVQVAKGQEQRLGMASGQAIIEAPADHLPMQDEQAGSTTIEITHKERELLEKLVHAEARGEPWDGKIAVANVVFNRVYSDLYPDTIEEVIFQPGQFPVAYKGTIDSILPDRETRLAVAEALAGKRVVGPDVLFFINEETAKNKWIPANREYATTIGSHSFFR